MTEQPKGAAVRLIRFFQAIAHPDWRGRAVASFLSGLLKIIRPRAKRIDSNLRLIHPDWDKDRRREIQRGVYENLAWTVTELLALQRNEFQAFDWIKEVQGVEIFDSLLSSPQGAVMLTGHFGSCWAAGLPRWRSGRGGSSTSFIRRYMTSTSRTW